MSKKIILSIIICFAVLGGLGYKYLNQEQGPIFTFADVARQDISQEVLVTGAVAPSEKIELQFKSAGKIESIFISKGDKVSGGQEIMKLENNELYIQKQQSQAALDLAQAKLDQLMAGESAEQIKVYETAVENVEKSVEDGATALANAEQNLANVMAVSETNLAQTYQSLLNSLDDAYLKMYNSLNAVDSIQRTYFDSNDQASIRAKENKQRIEDAVIRVEDCVKTARNSLINEDIDLCSAETDRSLNDINNSLIVIRDIMEEPTYRNLISSTDKTGIDNQRTYISAEITENISGQQSVDSVKIENKTNIDSSRTTRDAARASLNSYQGQLKTARDNLALAKAKPRETDIALYKAQIREAAASLAIIENKIQDSVLRAPISGMITNVFADIGETAIAGNPVAVMISDSEYQIEIDIPEADIGFIEPGLEANITLDAFPEQEFFGRVVEIEPAETIVQGVVYYKTRIGFADYSEDSPDVSDSVQTDAVGILSEKELFSRIKPGMTANIVIVVDSKKDVLTIPLRALQETDNIKFVRTPSIGADAGFVETEVLIGLRGSKGIVGVISGLNEGDKVITFIKEQ